MEKAVLRTLIYADIFDYPLTLREIHKWLISKKANLREVESVVKKLVKKEKIYQKADFFFLKNRQELVKSRIKKNKQSEGYLKKIKLIAPVLKINPWIKLVGVSGGLSMKNAGPEDDIDLFIITSNNRLWLSRFLVLGILELLDQRRKRSDSKREAAGKICCNILLEENWLFQENKDLYTAHEVLQMKVLWQRNKIYQKFLEENSWVFEYLPNWISNSSLRGAKRRSNPKERLLRSLWSLAMTNWLENLARNLQLKYMGESKGLERITEGALYFHPEDYREKILKEFKKRLVMLDK